MSLAAVVLLLVVGVTAAGLVFGGTGSPQRSSARPLHGSTGTLKGASSSAAKSPAPAAGASRLPSQGASSNGSAAAEPVTPITTVPSTIPPLPSGAVGQTARIEQSGTLSLRVRSGGVASTLTSLTTLATGSGGYVVDVQSQAGSGGSAPSGTMTMQVPEASFQTVLTQAQHLGRVTSVSTKATDETGQYVDLQARITALEASRQQYLTILAKATSIGDILAVQAQLDTLQSQLEQLQSQLGLLDSETTYSTLTVSLSEPGSHPVPVRSPSGLATAWHDSVHGFEAGAEGLLSAAGPVLFVVLCVGALVVLTRVGWRSWRRSRIA